LNLEPLIDIFFTMVLRHRLYIGAALAALFVLAWGCGGSSSTVPASTETSAAERATSEVRERLKRQALDHFIQGSLYDAQGDYAKAVLEYQDALRFDEQAATHHALAHDYMLLEKYPLAAQHARDAIRLDSLTIAYREQLARIYLQAFQPDLAIREYETIVRIDSNYTQGWYSLAGLYQPTRPLKALEIYERLLDREGDSWELLVVSAELYGKLGQFNAAADHYRRMLAIDPSNRALRRQLAETYVRAGSVDSAIVVLETMVEVDENDIETAAALADVYLQKGHFAKAIPLYERVLERVNNNPELLLRVGVSYFGQIQADSSFAPKANEILQRVAAITPTDWRPFFYLGAIAATTRQDSVAAHYFERVTELERTNFEAWWFLATFRFDRNEFRSTVDILTQAMSAIPTDARFYFLQGLSYSRLAMRDSAVTLLQRSLELDPQDMNTISTLALEYDGMEQFEKSDSLYERALRMDPESALILNNYGYSLADRGVQLERALSMALKAVEAEPDNSSYLDTLGWVYYRLGRYEEAERFILRAIEAGEASAVVLDHMGDVSLKLGKKDQAQRYWQQALEQDPTNQTVKNKLSGSSE
jgi:tetratricopeptide (TPR) repeat protein